MRSGAFTLQQHVPNELSAVSVFSTPDIANCLQHIQQYSYTQLSSESPVSAINDDLHS